MRIACVLTAEEARATPAEIFVFPEGVSRKTLSDAARAYPDSMVIGATEEGGYCHAILLANGRNHLDYRKICTDGFGRSQGTGYLPLTPIYETARVCIGVAICMDVNHADFMSDLRNRIKASAAAVKLLCVPGDMMSVWFSGGLHFCFEGIRVVVCNNVRTYQGAWRRASFIADASLQMVVVQKNDEPISSELA